MKAEYILGINKKWFTDKHTKSVDKQTKNVFLFLRDHSSLRAEAAIFLTLFHALLKHFSIYQIVEYFLVYNNNWDQYMLDLTPIFYCP